MSEQAGRVSERRTARRMIRSLTRGTTVADGAGLIHVGHDKWLAAQRELLEELEDDGGAETKFVRGAYGSGKSHFLVVMQDIAREMSWATAHVECKVDGVQIDRFETLYPQVVGKLRFPDIEAQEGEDDSGLEIGPVRRLLDAWSDRVLRRAGVRSDALSKPFDAANRVHSQLEQGLLRSNLPADFTKALAAYVRAAEAGDAETTRSVVEWLEGDSKKIQIPRSYLHTPDPSEFGGRRATLDLRPIGTGTAGEALRGVLWLIRNAGYAGLVLCIDEVEELAKLPTRKRRDQALQALREHVDNAGGDSGYQRLCLYLAATPAMFDDEQYFPRYDALQTRISAVSEEINWRAPVVDLDRTPLDLTQMKEMARRIRGVHCQAYGSNASSAFSDEMMDSYVETVVESRFRIAKPRLLARVVVDELERSRQSMVDGAQFSQAEDLEERVRAAAQSVSAEAES